jgi:hypothetical protein
LYSAKTSKRRIAFSGAVPLGDALDPDLASAAVDPDFLDAVLDSAFVAAGIGKPPDDG